MADFNILQQYATGGTSAQKMRDVAAASEARKAELTGITPQDAANAAITSRYGNGGATATPAEQVLNLSPFEQVQQLGLSGAQAAIRSSVDALNTLDRQTGVVQTDQQAITDNAVGVGMGAINSLGGLGALALGTVSPTLGGNAAQGLQTLNELSKNLQSDALLNRQAVGEARKALSSRDNQAKRETEGKGLLSDLRKIGRDTLDAIEISADDEVTMAHGVSQGIGSLLMAGPIARGLNAAGQTAMRAGGLTAATAVPTATTGAAAIPLAIGGMEAGGAYQQTFNESMKALESRTDLTHDQKVELANKTALDAAAYALPVAMAAGKLVDDFAARPFAGSRPGNFLPNLFKETTEEGIQGGASQIAGNMAIKQNIDANKDWTEGVGDQIGTGALYGLGTTAAVSAPGAALGSTGRVAQSAIQQAVKATGTVSRWVDKRVNEVQVKNDAASPMTVNRPEAAVQDLQANAEPLTAEIHAATEVQDTDSEKTAAAKTATREVFDNYMQHMTVQEAELNHPLMAVVADEIAGTTNRVEAIKKVVAAMAATQDAEQRVDMAVAMQGLMQPLQRGSELLAGMELDGLPTDVVQVIESIGDLAPAIQNSAEVVRALQSTLNWFDDADGQAILNNLNQTVDSAIKVALAAELAPEKVNPEVAGVVLKMARDGQIQLTPRQQAAIETARNVMLAAREYDEASKAADARPINIVSRQVKTDDDTGRAGSDRMSALQHGQRVNDLIQRGKMKEAKAALEDFGSFAQGQMNKVLAANQSLNAGGGRDTAVNPMVRAASGKMRKSRMAVGVTPTSAGSVRTVQMMAAEARFLATVHNGMAEAYPQLGVQPLQAPELDARLLGKPTEVAAAFSAGERQAGEVRAQTQEPVQQVQEQAAPEPVQAEVQEPAPVQEVVQEPEAIVEPENVEQTPAESAPADDATQPEQEPDTTGEVEPDPTADTDPAREEDAQPISIEAAFPNLINFGEGHNNFKDVFKPSRSRPALLRGTGSPIEAIREALSNNTAFTELTGKVELKRDVSADLAGFYRDDVMTMVENISAKVYEQLAAALDGSNGKKALKPDLDSGAAVADFQRAKVLSIVEKTPDGEYVYNQELIESAVLAGVNWLFGSKDSTNIKEPADVANILGIAEGQVSDGVLAMFQGSNMTLLDVIPAMARQITSFWGVTPNRAFDQSATVGIPYAVASEVLEAMVDLGYMTEGTVKSLEGVKTVNTFNLNADRLSDAYLEYPNLLADMLETEVDEPVYLNGDMPPVDRFQMNSKDVELTKEQLEMVRNESATPYKLNQPMYDLYQALGLDNILKMFAAGEISEETHNINNYESAQGKNQAIASAFQSYTARVAHMVAVANKQGIPVTELEVRYPYGVSSVGRAQMLGAFNPQASKLVREMIMPNRATVDLTNPRIKQMHNLALAQMMGIGIHKQSFEKTNAQLEQKIQELKPAIDLLVKQLETGKLDADGPAVIQQALATTGATFMGLHALVDLARMELAEDLSAFDTSVYVEADGVTNGPANAIMNMTAGGFTAEWVENAGKGGLNFQGMSMNAYRESMDSVDLYEQSTIKAMEHRENLIQDLEKAGLGEYSRDMEKLLSMFFKDIKLSLDDKGNTVMTMTRGAAKNPLTITVYGSGAAGIAGKITKTLMDAIYAEMTAAQQRHLANPRLNAAEAMFGHKAADRADAEAQMRDFGRLMNRFTQERVVFSKKAGQYIKMRAQKNAYKVVNGKQERYSVAVPRFNPQALLNFKEFTLHPDLFKVMQDNIGSLYTSYMRAGIEDTLGSNLMSTVEVVQNLTNLQSMALALEFEEAVIAERDRLYPPVNGKKSTRFLSEDQQAALMKELLKKYPLVKNQGQQFLVAKSSRSVQGVSDFSRSLSEKYKMSAAVYAPDAAGVKGVPSLNIGMGDGLMMQLMSNMPDAVQGTLKIFDGVNLPVDKVEEGSLQANTAVYQSWQGNIMADVMRAYKVASASIREKLGDDFRMGSQGRFAQDYARMGIENAEQLETMLWMEESLGDAYAKQIQARHNALKRVNMTVDQMASADQPYYHNGGVNLSQMDAEDIADELNKLYTEELAKLEEREQSVNEIKGILKDDSRPVTSYTAEGLLREARKFPADLYETVKTALRSPAMRDYVVHTGTKEQMEAKYGHSLGDENGITDTANKRIYIISSDPEVIAHELVHAATYENTAAVLDGTSKDQALIASVARLQELRAQFEEFVQSEALLEVTPEQMLSIRNLVNSMTQADALYGEAAGLNEFMAWSVTNANLIELGKKQTAKPSALANFTRRAVSLLRRIFFGGSTDRLPRDFFNQVRFNTALVASRRPQGLNGRMEQAILSHNSTYGNNERLNDVQRAYAEALAPILKTPQGMVTKLRSGQLAASLTAKVSSAFPMTGQAASTFRTIVGVLGTEASINPGSMAKAQELYNHVSKLLTVESFMRDSIANDPNDRAQAEAKHKMLMGKSGMLYDDRGRSSLMPAFLALATVDDGFREILKGLDVPRIAKYEGNTLDERLRNMGNGLMQSLADRMAGTNKSTNVTEAVDSINDHIAATVAEKETTLSQIGQAYTGMLDKGNDLFLQGIEKLSDKGIDLSDKMRDAGWGKSADMTELVSNLVVADRSEGAVEFGVSLMNNIKSAEGMRSLVNDVIGRIGSNANVYDMIKKVRSHIAAVRQEFRENVPERLESEFDNKPTDDQWNAITAVMAKTNLAALNMSWANIEKLLSDDNAMADAVAKAEDKIKSHAGKHAPTYFRKLEQLATFMNTGVPGTYLLRNARAVAHLFGEPDTGVEISERFIKDLDALGSLYAARKVPAYQKQSFMELAGDKGLPFMYAYLKQQAADELARAESGEGSLMNHYKGYVPTLLGGAESLVVVHDSNFSSMAVKSYERLGNYEGAGAERDPKRGYYFSKTPTNAPFQQGIVQNVVRTGGGVSLDWGFTQGMTAGVVDDVTEVQAMEHAILSGYETGSIEQAMPIFDVDGNVTAFERSVDPAMAQKLTKDMRANRLAGAWRGRQVEESMAAAVNHQLVKNLREMYMNDYPARRASEYVNLFDLKDKVAQDAWKLVSTDVRQAMQDASGKEGEFMVRRDVLQDVLGYRSATVGDAWSGNSRWSKGTLDSVRNFAIAIAGNDAYKHLVNSERVLMNYMGDARMTIAVKSVVVPVGNILSNMLQLVMRGVPLKNALADGLKYSNEMDTYVKNRLRQVDAEAELRAARTTLDKQRLTAEIQSLKDIQKRLSIWPLLEAGEFTAISDVGLNHEDTKLTKGKWLEYIESQVNKLPEGVRTAGKYAWISQDTALFQGLQKMVQYGDFIAKATLYHDLVGRKGMSPEDALGKVTEEFVNYDRLPGRVRGTLENVGLLWFYNFKLRIMKVAASIMRDNPFHALVAHAMPVPDFLGVGTPVTDNGITKAIEGTLGYSMGPGMGLSAPSLNPWWNMAN